MLPVRKCGNQGFECAAQGLGCMGLRVQSEENADEIQERESINLIHKAATIDGLMLDTADVYGRGGSEKLIRKGREGNEDTFKIATKFGGRITAASLSVDTSVEYMKQACEASLERLGVDCIDLYYMHRYDLKTPIKDVMRGFKELIDEGKIKYIGVSEMGIANLRKAHAIHPITAYQMEWSLFTRDVEEELVPTCRELGIGIVAYSPLGRGFLTGKIKSMDDIPEGDYRRNNPRFRDYMDDNLKLVEVVKEVAEAKGCTMGQVALAWLHQQGDDVFPIPGTKRVSRFEENIATVNIKLTDEELVKVEAIADKIKGERCNDSHIQYCYDKLQKAEAPE